MGPDCHIRTRHMSTPKAGGLIDLDRVDAAGFVVVDAL
jgi:hypothetical protein